MAPRIGVRLTRFLCTVALMLAFYTATTADAQSNCDLQVACKPHLPSGPACQRQKRINLRFMLETCMENNFTANGTVHHLATYGFCGVVDQSSSFTLTGAPFLTTSYKAPNPLNASQNISQFTQGGRHHYLSVYGFGASNSTEYPQTNFSDGTVLISTDGRNFVVNSSVVPNSVAVVTTLSLNIGLHNGLFNYIGAVSATNVTAPNPNYNASLCTNGSTTSAPTPTTGSSSTTVNHCDKEIITLVPPTVVQPAMVGFVPTCDANDQCIMGDPNTYVCIGDEAGKKNCGLVYTDPVALQSAQLNVWTSYYGTDVKKVTLTSGGDNPLHFATFSSYHALRTIGNTLGSVFSGNFSPVTG